MIDKTSIEIRILKRDHGIVKGLSMELPHSIVKGIERGPEIMNGRL